MINSREIRLGKLGSYSFLLLEILYKLSFTCSPGGSNISLS